MIKKLPVIFSFSIENIKQKIDDIIKLGYTKEELLKMYDYEKYIEEKKNGRVI